MKFLPVDDRERAKAVLRCVYALTAGTILVFIISVASDSTDGFTHLQLNIPSCAVPGKATIHHTEYSQLVGRESGEIELGCLVPPELTTEIADELFFALQEKLPKAEISVGCAGMIEHEWDTTHSNSDPFSDSKPTIEHHVIRYFAMRFTVNYYPKLKKS
ncbi:MAG: hypothetical protein A3A33_04480 [Candidatus Yanofskybacteria bacterium RIFCSPLOWO2_01_FULL_49_25]|uniref:Uncharacterized protein n=1 Tax=Candidatus Yanofskybacteria bacterium RIFCSPLOWO2_01_FULL_49_25 TaxID=1802701 RepID=A0A1F8GZ22_9BACT|nr:MAG: hypothetical protein A3A33_04480 [Candidatus Yanofskybacteria bacterium RIFCSPLOWO2_01_FULL_49_25]